MTEPLLRFTHLVRVKFNQDGDLKLPNYPGDPDGHQAAFNTWLGEQGILPVIGGASGPGRFVAYYEPHDAERVIAWWRNRLLGRGQVQQEIP